MLVLSQPAHSDSYIADRARLRDRRRSPTLPLGSRMSVQAPANLVHLLGRLRLASPAQIAAVGRRAVRLAGDLPDFESVWVDALAQRRMLTPWQAAEINAGRGEGLLHGPYRIQHRLDGPHYAQCFAAMHVESRREVRLYVARAVQRPLIDVLAQLQDLHQQSASLPDHGGVIEDYGTTAGVVWAAYPASAGQSIRDWMTENGRLPPLAVLQIARAMAVRLSELETHSLVHGDLSAAGLLIEPSGNVRLTASGLRSVLRPQEGYSFCDLPPEAYDYLAPERIAAGTPPSRAGDLYACACLWWHLLAGRPPFPGGNAIAKLKAAHAARVVDVRPYSPTVSSALAGAIESCLQRDPNHRPRSFAEVAERLGPPTSAGQALVASLVRGGGGAWQGMRRPTRRKRAVGRRSLLAASVGALAVLAVIAAPLAVRWHDKSEPNSLTAKPTTPEPRAAAMLVAPTERESERTSATSRVDPQVKAAAAIVPTAKPSVEPTVEPIVEDLVLPAGEILRVEHLDLVPHVRVRGRGGNRPQLSVPRRGLVIAYEDVSFEGVDFIWDRREREPAESSEHSRAMLDLRSQTATFRGCSFSSRVDDAPAAIRFAGASEALPGLGGELVLTDCVFDGLSTVVDHRASGAISVELNNCLCVAAGPILRLSRPPQPGDPVHLLLERVTTRGDTAVLHCRYGLLAGDTGAITITANGSALAGGGRAGLVILSGKTRPEPLVKALTWSGQGSIVTPQTPLLIWHLEASRMSELPDDDLPVAGLVRGALEFAGRPDGPPDASRVVRWQVPLRSPDPPGADPSKLFSPRSSSR